MTQRTVLLLGARGRTGEALSWVRELIAGRGHAVLQLELEDDRVNDIAALHAGGQFHGVLAIGDAADGATAARVLRELPIGVPKLLLSPLAAGNVGVHVGLRDVTMMQPVVDTATLNRISRRVLANAVGAVCGMVEQDPPVDEGTAPWVAATMFGVTTPCVTAVRERLEAAGYDVLVFHATGTGGRAMEGLIDDGWFAGVVDVTTTEWADEVVGGMRSAGPDRLGAAGRRGLPQVVSLGALDIVNFAAADTVPLQWRDRTLYRHNPNATLMRTTAAECTEIGRRIAERLNAATGPTVLMIPLRGLSMIDCEGGPFHDPAADRALFDAVRRHAGPGVTLVELDFHINDPAFAEAVASRFLQLMKD